MVWFLLLLLTPMVEMYLLIQVGGYIGALATVLLVMLTAVVGLALLRRQGLATLTRGRERLEQGDLPAQEVIEGVLLAVAGALLLTPGFVTDAVGFALLLPVLRARVAAPLLERLVVPQPDRGGAGRVIEGEFEVRERSPGSAAGTQPADASSAEPPALGVPDAADAEPDEPRSR